MLLLIRISNLAARRSRLQLNGSIPESRCNKVFGVDLRPPSRDLMIVLSPFKLFTTVAQEKQNTGDTECQSG